MQRDLRREAAIAKSLPLKVWRPRAARPFQRRADTRAAKAYISKQVKIQRELEGLKDILKK